MTVMPSPMLTDRFSRAFEFASVVHATQVRKGTRIPYLSHLLAVASLVIEHGADEDTAIAALLHDAAEDRGGQPMLEQIRARFGERVADTVHGCTDSFERQKGPYAERKTRYVEHLAGDASEETCLVSAADKLHNARSILHDLRAAKNDAHAFWARFGSTPTQSGWYYGRVETALARRLAHHDGREMVTEIHRALDGIAEMDGCASFASGLALGRAAEACPADRSESRGAPG